jgi:hypothetical protein
LNFDSLAHGKTGVDFDAAFAGQGKETTVSTINGRVGSPPTVTSSREPTDAFDAKTLGGSEGSCTGSLAKGHLTCSGTSKHGQDVGPEPMTATETDRIQVTIRQLRQSELG